jgi:hypothetical protein
MENNEINKAWYENIEVNKTIYYNIDNLLNENPNIYKEESIIFCLNSNSGFGSQLSLLLQTGLYFQTINHNIHCLGHFNKNYDNFKYHDKSCINSFFLYFKYLKNISENINYYFIDISSVINENKFKFIQPISIEGSKLDDIPINKMYFDFFKQNFKLIIGNHIKNNIEFIKTETNLPVIGLHIRSMYQLLIHRNNRNWESIEQKILQIKDILDKKYEKYNVFFVTDVLEYIDIAKQIFNNINCNLYYNNNINRIKDGTTDSICKLDEFTGFKLGSDIIYDCLSLINCDEYYVSKTNIAFIAGCFSEKNNGIHFN